MTHNTFPPLPLSSWRATRDTLAGYSQVVGKIRRALTPPQKHWWHASLHVSAAGLTTTPVWSGSQMFEVVLDHTGARWHTAGWTRAVLPYAVLTVASDPQAQLLDFLHTAHQASARFMRIG